MRLRLPTGAGRRTALRTTALTAGLAVLAGGLAGCGIRGTAVPVDAGSAPSRASCVVRSTPQSLTAPSTVTTSVQLVCTSQLLPVPRVVTVPEGSDPMALAQVLLDELKRQPTPGEDEAGFSTDVPQRLTLGAPRKGDPAGTLRLNVAPQELPPVALAQLVCTFAGTPAADGRATVVLGGPGEDDRPLGYPCTDETRTRPEAVRGGATTPP